MERYEAAHPPTCPDDQHQPDPDGTHCLRCGILAEPAPLTPDAAILLLTMPADMERYEDRIRWSVALRQANDARREMLAAARLTPDELATAAARFGIAAGPIPRNAGGDASYPARMHAAVGVYGSLRATVAGVAAGRRHETTQTFHAYPGDTLAAYDASEERYNLSPSGPWHATPPPIYAAGQDATPTCDLCGRPEDQDPTNGREYDWNGETGNHLSCEGA